MKDLPRPKGTRVLTPALAKFVALVIGASSILLIVTYGLAYRITQDEVFTRTIVFAALGVVSLFVVYPVRSLRRGVWQIAVFSNRYLTAAVLFGIVMLVAAIYLRPPQCRHQIVKPAAAADAFGHGTLAAYGLGYNCRPRVGGHWSYRGRQAAALRAPGSRSQAALNNRRFAFLGLLIYLLTCL